jgi:hypothetical protein
MTQAAAIRRASQQGRSAMHELDAAGVDDLVRIYQAAADEVRGRINAAVDNTDRESSLQALERLSPEVRAGAIVQTSEAQPVQSLPPHHAGESSDRPRYPLWHVDGSNTKGLNRVFPRAPLEGQQCRRRP